MNDASIYTGFTSSYVTFFIFATECGLFPGLDVRDVDECGLVSVFFLATAGFNLYAIEKPLGL